MKLFINFVAEIANYSTNVMMYVIMLTELLYQSLINSESFRQP